MNKCSVRLVNFMDNFTYSASLGSLTKQIYSSYQKVFTHFIAIFVADDVSPGENFDFINCAYI